MNAQAQTLELVPTEPKAQPMVAASNSPADIMRAALASGMSAGEIRDLLAVQKEWEENEARKQFNIAFAQFKAEAVRVYKGTTITDGPLKGKRHANLFDVVVASAAPLAKHGLSTSWRLTKDEPQLMEVTCVLKHSAGHSESVSMSAAPDTGPGRNAIQSRGSAKSYLERYTLMAILGLAATDQEDDDGRGSDKSDEQRAAEENARKVQQSWLDAIDACADDAGLAALKKELVKSCGGSDKVPANLVQACVTKKAALAK